jgi:hypothetical protein
LLFIAYMLILFRKSWEVAICFQIPLNYFYRQKWSLIVSVNGYHLRNDLYDDFIFIIITLVYILLFTLHSWLIFIVSLRLIVFFKSLISEIINLSFASLATILLMGLYSTFSSIILPFLFISIVSCNSDKVLLLLHYIFH